MTAATPWQIRQTLGLTPEEREQFRTQGFVRLGRVASHEQIESLRQRIDDIMLGNVKYDDMFLQLCRTLKLPEGMKGASRRHQLATLQYRKIQDLEQDPVYRDYIAHRVFRAITRELIGESVAVFRAMFMNKAAGAGTRLHWHQDGANWHSQTTGWGLTHPPTVTLWTALDPATRANGCVQLLPATHSGVFSKSGEDYPTEDEVAALDPQHNTIYLEMEAGEVALLHNWTLHSSDANTTNQPRRAFSTCYIDGNAADIRTGKRFTQIFPQFIWRPDRANTSMTY